MKAWFFYSTEKGSKGRWNSAYEVMIQKDGCMTFGSTLWEAVYMAHDLVACVTEGYGDCGEIRWVEDYEKEFAELGVSSDGYCGMMDIDVDSTDTGWVRKGDLQPRTRQHTRYGMYLRAFKLSYSGFRLAK